MRLPSVKKLDYAFPGKGLEIRELLERRRKTSDYKSVQDLERQCYHPPSYMHRLLTALNEVAECHGIECVRRKGEVEMEYLNTGDTYTATLIYDYTTNTWKVQSMGDWIETAERRGRKYG